MTTEQRSLKEHPCGEDEATDSVKYLGGKRENHMPTLMLSLSVYYYILLLPCTIFLDGYQVQS